MNRLAAAALAAALTAGSAAAIPPPPEVAVVILAPGGGTDEDSQRLLAQVAPEHGGGWLRLAEPAFTAADFAACETAGSEQEACIRGVLTERGAAGLEGPPTVIVALSPGPGFHRGWTCVGVGEGPTQPDRQRITIDFTTLRASGSDPAATQVAAGCITAAAAESGW